MLPKPNKIIKQLKIRLWNRNLSAAFADPFFKGIKTEGLRLIIGPGRSGTSWLSRIMSRTSTPITFFNEPLHPFKIRLPYTGKWDHTAVRYSKHLDTQSPLIRLYSLLSYYQESWEKYLPEKIVLRNDKNAKYALIKEVHSLLATEALLNSFNCPVILITRNPVYVVDSVLSFRGLDASIWRTESEYVAAPEFLEAFNFSKKDKIISTLKKFRDDPDSRQGVIVAKTVTVAVINKMLKALADRYDNAMHVSYEDLCLDPAEKFKILATFLELDTGNDFDNFLNSSLEEAASDNPYSIFRNTGKQLDRPFRFLKQEETGRVTEVLDTCNLL